MKSFFKKYGAVAIILLSVIGCSSLQKNGGITIQKKRYSKGWYVSLPAKMEAEQKSIQIEIDSARRETEAIVTDLDNRFGDRLNMISELQDQVPNIQNSGSVSVVVSNVKFQVAPSPSDSTCDLIILKDGEEIEAMVAQVTDDEVKYRKCDNPRGPLYTKSKSKIFMIRYANGTKDVFNSENSSSNQRVKSSEPTSYLGTVFGVLGSIGGIFIPLFGWVFGGIGLAISNKNNDNNGVTLSLLAIILSTIAFFYYLTLLTENS